MESMGNQKNILLVKGITVISDYISVVLGLLAAYQLRVQLPFFSVSPSFVIEDYYVYAVIPFIFISVLALNNSYHIDSPYWDKIKTIFRSVTIGTVVSIVLMYTGHVIHDVSRLFIAFSYMFIFFLVILERFTVGNILRRLGLLYIPVLLVGAGKTAELVKKAIDRMPINYYRIIGYVDDDPKSSYISSLYPRLGGFDEVEQVVKDTGVQSVLICAPGLEANRLVELVNRLQLLVRRVSFVPELFGLPTGNISARGLMEEQAVVIRVQNNLARKLNRFIKRLFDIILTVCGGILILPVIAIIALLVCIDSPGPVVFGHKRIGQHGKEFYCYKFRSMVADAEDDLEAYLDSNPDIRKEWERDFKLKDDPRITRIGRFLRKTSLDELPQLWNVLIGDMSLVGPRPIVKEEIEKYGSYINDFYLVPPGITGVWQVSGRSDTTYDERVQMDSWYVHNWSIWIDIVYLLKTVPVVVKGKGAY